MTTQSQLRIRHRSAFQTESPATIFPGAISILQRLAVAGSVTLGV
jgi:hypothetical protein